MTVRLNQVPPMDEVWNVGGTLYLVRFVDRAQPPIPLVWRVSGDEATALGITKSRNMGSSDFARSGALNMGSTLELINTTEDPVELIYSNFDTEAKVKPWLQDPEILSIWVGAALEGRSITDAELQGTEWWRTHTQTERQWLSLNASDPSTARTFINDNRARVAQLIQDAGVDNASRDLVNLIADQWTQGSWSELYATNQIRLLADPNLQGRVDPLLRGQRRGLDTIREGEEDVRRMVNTWLGPAHAAGFGERFISQWATQLRENPDAQTELTELLRQHRLALFPEYKDATLTYEDIAGPWRGVFQQVWGQTADETDPIFAKVVRMNDLAGAESLLRTEGLKRDNQTVVEDLLSSLSAFGGQVRRADPAVF